MTVIRGEEYLMVWIAILYKAVDSQSSSRLPPPSQPDRDAQETAFGEAGRRLVEGGPRRRTRTRGVLLRRGCDRLFRRMKPYANRVELRTR